MYTTSDAIAAIKSDGDSYRAAEHYWCNYTDPAGEMYDEFVANALKVPKPFRAIIYDVIDCIDWVALADEFHYKPDKFDRG